MIKLAVIGTGTIAQLHASAAQSLAGCELVAVVNHRPESMARFAVNYGIAQQYLSLEILITDGEVDAIISGTPNALHTWQSI